MLKLKPVTNQTFVDATIPGTWSYIALPPKILVQTRLGLRVAVFSRFRPLLRKGHTCVTKMTSDWSHISRFWQAPITLENLYMPKLAST